VARGVRWVAANLVAANDDLRLRRSRIREDDCRRRDCKNQEPAHSDASLSGCDGRVGEAIKRGGRRAEGVGRYSDDRGNIVHKCYRYKVMRGQELRFGRPTVFVGVSPSDGGDRTPPEGGIPAKTVTRYRLPSPTTAAISFSTAAGTGRRLFSPSSRD